ncbi:MAG: class II aldolase/adducin family protein [Abyssibacter sp.]|nr:class II aldolase/adducin family protein [Abyssibacter sp.]MCK5859218.1 class II aldolase/adducin family protein [Abyssibacter sp.]
MAEQEGVIKYRLDYHPAGAPAESPDFAALRAWRDVLHRLGLVGQQPDRYDGYGFGNVSLRRPAGFLISGTQTGLPVRLAPQGYAEVTRCNVAANHIIANGPVKPSSEALTHGAVYAVDERIGAVLHAHSPEIWHHGPRYPATAADVPYGTPAMAQAVAQLYRDSDLPEIGLFTMRGHTDGVVAFGATAEQAGQRLVAALARSLVSV